MRAEDLPAVESVAAAVHADYPEGAAVFAERLRLFPAGCLVLEREGTVTGYVVSHPWHRSRPPALDTLLCALPGAPGTYYLHDIALLPAARGGGAAREALRRLEALAQRQGLAEISLVAVGGSAPFWRRQGFREVDDPALAAKLRSYGEDACFMQQALIPAAG
ncbi:GNAT family N-acetyltransferase [Roseomonas sp. OT10]|uniref:GNAT family N-acetyltransferase n=1 Tax=Roseomonas cutis TaxID=2897332 RepID=UPI001E3A7E0E|nr:GNAT family N-acetyltransferase [Roseomonas sp. OT10]UFN49649.1 GNAT family N-acetyltransferase [Roseomonas sp. OT10]